VLIQACRLCWILSEATTQGVFQGFGDSSSLEFSACWCGSPADAQYEIISELNFQNRGRPAETQITIPIPPAATCIYGPQSAAQPAERTDDALASRLQPQRKPPPSLTGSRLLSHDCGPNMSLYRTQNPEL